jgi:glycerophosphoryl diester phosphodiesterase
MRRMESVPLLLGHRGSRLSQTIPENSLAAFDLALEHGCDGFEFDLRRTRCECSVVCHDETFQGVKIASAAAHQMPDLPHLEDVLARYGQRVFLDIELKVSGMEYNVLALLREHLWERNYVVSSFLPDVVLKLKARKALPVGIICGDAAELKNGRELPADYVIAHKSLITEQLIKAVHRQKQKIFAWTVNDQPSMLQLAEWEVDGIISDDTQLLAATFGRSKPMAMQSSGG